MGFVLLQVQPTSMFVGKEIKSYEEWGRELTIGLGILILVVLVATLVFQRKQIGRAHV